MLTLHCNATIKLAGRPPANPRHRFVKFRQFSSKHGSMNNWGLFLLQSITEPSGVCRATPATIVSPWTKFDSEYYTTKP